MKNFQRNLFVLLAFALCATCAYQWYWQAAQLQKIEKLNDAVYEQSGKIQEYTNSLQRADDNVSQLNERVAQLKRDAVIDKGELARLKSSESMMSNEIIQYKAVVGMLTNKLDQAIEGEKQLAAQRDEFVQKLNGSIQARNDLTSNYNALAGRFNKLQAAQK